MELRQIAPTSLKPIEKKRAAIYARVSSDKVCTTFCFIILWSFAIMQKSFVAHFDHETQNWCREYKKTPDNRGSQETEQGCQIDILLW